MNKNNSLYSELRKQMKISALIIFIGIVTIGTLLSYYRHEGNIKLVSDSFFIYLIIAFIISFLVFHLKPGHCPKKVKINEKEVIFINNSGRTQRIPWNSIESIKVKDLSIKSNRFYYFLIKSNNIEYSQKTKKIGRQLSETFEKLLKDKSPTKVNIRLSKEIGNEIIEFYKKYGNGNLKKWKNYPNKPK